MRKLESKGNNILYSRTRVEKVIFAVIFLLFVIYAISLIIPFVWLLMMSLKDGIEYELDNAMQNAFSLPDTPIFQNFVEAFSKLSYDGTNFLQMLFNSIWYVGIAVFFSVMSSSITAYCISKYTFTGRSLIYGIAIFSMTIPIVGTLGASFKLASDIGLYNSPLYVVFSSMGGFGFNFLVMYSCFKGMSWNYAESVFVDGGGHYTAFFRVMLPQARGPMITLAILSGIGCWNDYTSVIMFLPSYSTVSAGLYFVERELTRGNMPIFYAALFISLTPVLIIYSIFSGRIMSNISMGGFKE